MVKQPAYVSVVLFIMNLRLERRILPRMVYAAIFYATQSLEIKLGSQVNLMFLKAFHTSSITSLDHGFFHNLIFCVH